MKARRQRGSIDARTLADGTTVYDVRFRGVDGKSNTRRGFPTKGAAQSFLNDTLPAVETRTWARIQPVTVREYVTTWVKARSLKPSSRTAYDSLARKVAAVLGAREVSTITPGDVNALLAHYGSQKVKTRKNLLLFVRACFADAVADHHTPQDPTRDRRVQKLRAIDADDDGEIEILSAEDVGRLLDAAEAEGLDWRVFVQTLASSGIRIGEALALRWADLDLVKGLLHVRRTAFGGKFYLPKSKKSLRGVDIGDQLVGALAALKRVRLGDTEPDPEALVFPGEGTKHRDPSALRRGPWARTLTRAGLPHRRVHSLRHTYASLLIESGEDLKYVSGQLGHSSITITADRYGHLLKGRRRTGAAHVEASLGLAALPAPVRG